MCIKDYEILSENTLVAIWQDGNLEIINESLLPLYLKRVSDADMWLETRAIDSHRANSRLLKKALRMEERDDISTVIRANGATITDNYWVREIGSNLKYDDVKFDSEYFSSLITKASANIALKGSYTSFNYVSTRSLSNSAELTNTGSFEKCWKMNNGSWWMFKSATANEIFSEVFISILGKKLGINVAKYEKGEKCVKSLNFTDENTNFEPGFSFMGENEDYTDTINKLNELCPEAIADYVRMIFLDALIANPDRHTANFGLLRDVDTGKITGSAPCFDHNMALISRGYPSKSVNNDLLIRLFVELIGKFPEYREYIPEVTQDIIIEAIDETNMKVRRKAVIDFVWQRYLLIREGIKEMEV